MSQYCAGGCYPFLALADPDAAVASLFGVKICRSYSLVAMKQYAAYFCVFSRGVAEVISNKNVRQEAVQFGDNFVIPSELLIDESGCLVDIFRAKWVSETMPRERVEHFLLHGTALENEEKENMKNNAE